ncbi:MAG: hypothetical protein WBM83_02455, partial [Flavobacteriaceae bacterium]
VSEPFLALGIEDNDTKTTSNVCVYNYTNEDLYTAQPKLTLYRKGEAKHQTAGATGLIALNSGYLMVVSNWDSRNWDFYHVNLDNNEKRLLLSFAAPDDWASYQSINLIKDKESIYAIGFYKKELLGKADLILVSLLGNFEPRMEKVLTKTFSCNNNVDFGGAAGLQIDKEGKLHIWATQKNPLNRIAVNKFSQQ